jgi:Uma2 family endonuclease
VLSPCTRKTDLDTKRELYDRFSVREYWVVDPDADEVTVYGRDVSVRFSAVAHLIAAAGDVLTTALLPRFSIPLARLFAAPRRGSDL